MVTDLATGMKVALILEYNGANYHGSQYQANAPTVQGQMEKALQELTGEKTRMKAASRTDAGVHAIAQVAHFDTLAARTARSWGRVCIAGSLRIAFGP